MTQISGRKSVTSSQRPWAGREETSDPAGWPGPDRRPALRGRRDAAGRPGGSWMGEFCGLGLR